jgi:hypothetical protein
MLLFTFSPLVATPARWPRLKDPASSRGNFLARYVNSDWGEVPPEDIKENNFSLKDGFHLISIYSLGNVARIWVLSKADRSVTDQLPFFVLACKGFASRSSL